jgi:Ca2+-binding EF-hand superfamily protein
MGPAYSYLNVWAVSTIVSAHDSHVETVLQGFEKDYRIKHSAPPSDAAEPHDGGEQPAQQPLAPANYKISETSFTQLFADHDFSPSDRDILINIFHLIDTRGFKEIDLRDALISFSVLTAKSVHEGFELAMRLMEREGTQTIDKRQLIHIFKLMNATFSYFGDKHLQMDQVQDLADSLYTSIGRIDGTIFYPHYIEFLVAHPIVEMFMSMQYQGTMKDKLLTDAEIDAKIDAK